MKKTTILAALFATSIVTVAQTSVSTYTPGTTTEGIAYYLPKTAINVNITIEKSSYTPGELCQYADRYLRISGTSDKEDVQYRIKDATIETTGIPDESKLYHIKFAANTVAPLIDLDDSGILLAVNTENPYAHTPKTDNKTTTTHPLNPRAYMTEEMLMTGSKAKMAELVAKEIYNIRESRNLLLRGQSENMPKDGEGLQIILNNIKEQEEALMQLFIGSTVIEETTHTFQILPESEAERLIFGRFSRKLGLLHQDDLGGAPLYIDIKSRNTVPAAPAEQEEDGKKKKIKTKAKDTKQDGLVYNIPGRANVKVYTNTVTLADETVPLTQFGNKETLSSSLFSKRKDIKVILDPNNGAIKKIEE